MPARRGTRLWISGFLGLTLIAMLAAFLLASKGRPLAQPTPEVVIDDATALPVLAQALRESDARALAAVVHLTAFKADAAPLTEAEADRWAEILNGVRAGFLKFGTYGRASALAVTSRVLQKFTPEPAPKNWLVILTPAHDLLTSGVADTNLDVRAAALSEIAGLWSWAPGRPLIRDEEDVLADWKNGFHGPVLRRLGDRDAKTRVAAVACLGKLPDINDAAQAVAYLGDPSSPEVRKQVLISFAARPALLTEDAILKHIDDKGDGVAEAAEIVLKIRGLTQEQISLGSMIFHPKPEIRASVIPLIKDRSDIDPVVWLIQLSRDSSEAVRMGAVEALAQRKTPEVGQRLAEMAVTDSSPAIRRLAGKYAPEHAKTASLPALPGSPSLNPRAN